MIKLWIVQKFLVKVNFHLQEKSYYALAAFCENMGEEILPFLDPLMGKLLSALQTSPRNLQETCMVQRIPSFKSSPPPSYLDFEMNS